MEERSINAAFTMRNGIREKAEIKRDKTINKNNHSILRSNIKKRNETMSKIIIMEDSTQRSKSKYFYILYIKKSIT